MQVILRRSWGDISVPPHARSSPVSVLFLGCSSPHPSSTLEALTLFADFPYCSFSLLLSCPHSSLDVCLAGELEKQQGAKTLSLRTNGAQMELQSKQGSPTGKRTPNFSWPSSAAFANVLWLIPVRTTAESNCSALEQAVQSPEHSCSSAPLGEPAESPAQAGALTASREGNYWGTGNFWRTWLTFPSLNQHNTLPALLTPSRLFTSTLDWPFFVKGFVSRHALA